MPKHNLMEISKALAVANDNYFSLPRRIEGVNFAPKIHFINHLFSITLRFDKPFFIQNKSLADMHSRRISQYATAPIARVNCKKQIGVSTIQDTDLGSHMERYAHFLREQIALYDADIILCCGGHGIIKDFVKQHYLPDLQCFSSDGWVYYSPTSRKVVIDSYHPTFAKSFKSIELYYEQMMSDVKAFIAEHPEYLRRTT
jgi:hypothetical protein